MHNLAFREAVALKSIICVSCFFGARIQCRTVSHRQDTRLLIIPSGGWNIPPKIQEEPEFLVYLPHRRIQQCSVGDPQEVGREEIHCLR